MRYLRLPDNDQVRAYIGRDTDRLNHDPVHALLSGTAPTCKLEDSTTGPNAPAQYIHPILLWNSPTELCWQSAAAWLLHLKYGKRGVLGLSPYALIFLAWCYVNALQGRTGLAKVVRWGKRRPGLGPDLRQMVIDVFGATLGTHMVKHVGNTAHAAFVSLSSGQRTAYVKFSQLESNVTLKARPFVLWVRQVCAVDVRYLAAGVARQQDIVFPVLPRRLAHIAEPLTFSAKNNKFAYLWYASLWEWHSAFAVMRLYAAACYELRKRTWFIDAQQSLGLWGRARVSHQRAKPKRSRHDVDGPPDDSEICVIMTFNTMHLVHCYSPLSLAGLSLCQQGFGLVITPVLAMDTWQDLDFVTQEMLLLPCRSEPAFESSVNIVVSHTCPFLWGTVVSAHLRGVSAIRVFVLLSEMLAVAGPVCDLARARLYIEFEKLSPTHYADSVQWAATSQRAALASVAATLMTTKGQNYEDALIKMCRLTSPCPIAPLMSPSFAEQQALAAEQRGLKIS